MEKRVLICAPRLPEFDRQSGSKRIFDLIAFSMAQACELTFLPLDSSGQTRYVSLLHRQGVRVITPDDLENVLRTESFALAVLQFWHVAEGLLPVIRRLSPSTRVLIDTVDLHFVRHSRNGNSGGDHWEFAQVRDHDEQSAFRRELGIYAASDGIVAVSEREAHILSGLLDEPERIAVVPDGEDMHRSTLGFQQRRGILFVGNFWHSPNIQAIDYFCEQITPRLDLRLLATHPLTVLGNGLARSVYDKAASVPYARVPGWVPSLTPYLQHHRISVVPLLTGAGTKRKLIQSLLAGTPAVTTSCGAEGLDVEPGRDVLVADDADSFADAIRRLLSDRALWERLSQNGYERMMSAHSRAQMEASFRQASARCLSRPARNPSLKFGNGEWPSEVLPHLSDNTNLALIGAKQPFVFQRSSLCQEIERSMGQMPGFYPADALSAIRHVTAAVDMGAEYILFPPSALWWLGMREFRNYLEANFTEVSSSNHHALFAVRSAVISDKKQASVLAKQKTPCRPRPAPGLSARMQSEIGRKQVLIVGIYLADKPNNVRQIATVLSSSRKFAVTQLWAAIGDTVIPELEAHTLLHTASPLPKFELINSLLRQVSLQQFEYLILCDDDVALPQDFLDHYLTLQGVLDFKLAQPARTGDSYIDHPIVEQQLGVVARETLFVESGPVVSIHRSAFDLMIPFDLSSPMGWGYENVWSYRLSANGMKMGIIDALPVEHRMRRPTSYYSWHEADSGRQRLLHRSLHRPMAECLRVLAVVPA